jgi:hypothetical protein
MPAVRPCGIEDFRIGLCCRLQLESIENRRPWDTSESQPNTCVSHSAKVTSGAAEGIYAGPSTPAEPEERTARVRPVVMVERRSGETMGAVKC